MLLLTTTVPVSERTEPLRPVFVPETSDPVAIDDRVVVSRRNPCLLDTGEHIVLHHKQFIVPI